jgi:hypothetical protein
MKVSWVCYLRGFALVAIGLSGVILYDFAAPPSDFVEARVTHTTHKRVKSGTTYYIHTVGERKLSESVPKDVHDLAQTGDTMRLKLTPVFLEWKEAVLVRDNQVLASFHGRDLYFMGLFGALFVLTLAAFFSRSFLLKFPYIPVGVAVLELLAVALCIVLLNSKL